MAISSTFTGNGSAGPFTIGFAYLNATDVKVEVDSVLQTQGTNFTVAGSALTFTSGSEPANGAVIYIYRDTASASPVALFSAGAPIKAADLNNNYTQNRYVAEEADSKSDDAVTTSNTAKTTADSAVTTANSAVTTANTAASDASSAVTTANTAASDAASAVTTANTAASDAASAVTTANTASTNASAAVATANTAASDASTAVSTANTASTNASSALTAANNAVTTANTAATDASSAVTTANTAATDAASAVTTANSASTTANNAVTTANSAVTTANTAASDAASAVTTANTAATDAASAVTTANTASTNASNAVTTANTAASDASTALSTANTADTNASTALSTANTAATNASTAITTANTAASDAASAVTTANTAASDAASAVTTANTAASDASSAVTTANTAATDASNAVSTANAASAAVSGKLDKSGGTMTGAIDMGSNLINAVTDPVSAQDAATKNYVDTEISGLVDAAPGTLDTLNELAAALGDDANFSTTVTNSIATKLPLAGGTMTGDIVFNTGQTIDGYIVETSATGSAEIPAGTDAQRDASPSAGYMRFNTTSSTFEGYDGTSWTSIGAGSSGPVDADTLDTLDSTSFLRSDADDTTTGRLEIERGYTSDTDYHLYINQTTNTEGATIKFTDDATEGQYGLFTYKHADSSSNSAGNSFHFNSSETDTAVIIDQTAGNSGFYVGTNEVWHAGNDGSGSGLDADLLDGLGWDSAGKNLRGTEVYADNWFRNYNSGEGLYNETNQMHWYSDSNSKYRIHSNQSNVGITFATNGNATRAHLYSDTQPSIGFLNSAHQWGLRYLSNDGLSPNLWFREEGNETWTGNPGNDTGKVEYHSNRFYIAAAPNATYICVFRNSAYDRAWVENGGNIVTTGNITAYYSDERLKDKLGAIENPLDKLMSLEGFRYVNNDLAKSLGYDSTEVQLGVSAQAVQKVAPEVVSIAAFDRAEPTEEDPTIRSKSGENYLTVQSDKLVPLLIEAIKEQQSQIEELKKGLSDLMEANKK